MKSVIVVGEVFNPNLGDAVIFDCIKYIFGRYDVVAVPLDLGGRTSWDECDERPSSADRLIRAVAKSTSSKTLRKLYHASSWYLRVRNNVYSEWKHAISASDGVVIGGGQILTGENFNYAPKMLEICRIAKLHRKPLAIFGCGVAPNWGVVSTTNNPHNIVYVQKIFVANSAVTSLLM